MLNQSHYWYNSCFTAASNKSVLEARLLPMMFGIVLFAGGLFIFEWISGRDLLWIALCISAAMMGSASFTICKAL